jgi:Pyridine nucleotide-disulphide oxidoreductase, dimerisation domain/Pyridine nucleotide-disulphide oxidoreductase
VRVTLDPKGEASVVEADVVLVAVGRRAYTEGLGARELGVKIDERGRIVVNERFETSVPGVFAIGDAIPGPMLAHKAEEEGVAAVELMAGQAGHVDYDAIPNVVYTWPELASVGLSEEEAAERGLKVTVGAFPFQANGRARCMDETEGTVKILADTATDRIVGLHILGPRASVVTEGRRVDRTRSGRLPRLKALSSRLRPDDPVRPGRRLGARGGHRREAGHDLTRRPAGASPDRSRQEAPALGPHRGRSRPPPGGFAMGGP